MIYTAVFEQADDGGWCALVPDLPGLVLMGETRDEIVRTAPDIIRDYLDAMAEQGLAVSPPGSYVAQIEVELT